MKDYRKPPTYEFLSQAFPPLSTPVPDSHNNQCPSCAYIYLHVPKAVIT
jgi:hypothetical protein